MCSRQEIEDIIKKEVAIVRNDLIQHEGREVLGHKELEERINDRIDHVLVAVRASHPSAETMKEIIVNQTRIEEKLDELKGAVTPAIKVIDTAGNIRTGIIWIAAPIVAAASMLAAFIAFKNYMK